MIEVREDGVYSRFLQEKPGQDEPEVFEGNLTFDQVRRLARPYASLGEALLQALESSGDNYRGLVGIVSCPVSQCNGTIYFIRRRHQVGQDSFHETNEGPFFMPTAKATYPGMHVVSSA